MELFRQDIESILIMRDRWVADGSGREMACAPVSWPAGGGRQVILGIDTGIELGSPSAGSMSFMLWTEESGMVRDGRISIAGPDVQDKGARGQSLPLGKLVLVEVEGMDAHNLLQRQREMEHTRYAIHLEGYSVRAASSMFREWVRVHRDAVDRGFHLSIMGSALRAHLLKLDYVKGVELVLVTSPDIMGQLQPAAQRLRAIYDAIYEIENYPLHDCNNCSNEEICNEIEAIRELHNAAGKKENVI